MKASPFRAQQIHPNPSSGLPRGQPVPPQPKPFLDQIGRSPQASRLFLGAGRAFFKLQTSVVHQIPWRERALALGDVDWAGAVATATDPAVEIPPYAKRPIHGIPDGNGLTQALEQQSAMEAIAALFGHEPGLRNVRSPLLSALGPDLKAPRLLDLGAGTGDSLATLRDRYPDAARLTGVDLSPAMVAVGRERFPEFELLHGKAEKLPFEARSFDLVSTMALCHELPKKISLQIFREAFRVLEPGGTFFFADMNPESETVLAQLQLGILGRAIEPFLASYLKIDPRAELEACGFKDVRSYLPVPGATMIGWAATKPE